MTINIGNNGNDELQQGSIKLESIERLDQHENEDLIRSAKENDARAFKAIVTKGANILARDSGGFNVLHYIAKNDNEGLFAYMLDRAEKKGYDIQELINSKALKGESVLDIAAEYSSTSVLDALLLRDVSINVSRLGGATPLHFAAENCLISPLKGMLTNTIKYIDKKDVNGNTPLHFAVDKNCYGAVKLLVDNDSKLNVINNAGEYAIHIAALKGNIEIVSALLYQAADTAVVDKYGNLPIHLAAMHGHTDIVAKLAYVIGIDKLNSQHKTPLFLAAENGHKETFKYLANNGANIDYSQPQTGARIIDAASSGRQYRYTRLSL
jgi:ankyrin repeat protein